MGDLSGRVGVVTGAGQGIGRSIALALAKDGAKVIITDITDHVFDVLKEIQAQGGDGFAEKCDVTDPKEGVEAVNLVLGKFGELDVLVNNAGVYPAKPFTEMSGQDWDKVMQINLKGVFHCTKAALPGMIKRRYGKIISISSIAGTVVGFSNLVHYSASKAGIMGFTRSLALEVAEYGINVNAIAPGPIETEGTSMTEVAIKEYAKQIPLGRVGLPQDVANLAVFLASERSNFITGQCIVVDGGYTLP